MLRATLSNSLEATAASIPDGRMVVVIQDGKYKTSGKESPLKYTPLLRISSVEDMKALVAILQHAISVNTQRGTQHDT